MRSPANRCSGSGAGEVVQIELFERPRFSPLYPPHASLAGEALKMLLDGQQITHLSFQKVTSSWRLAAYIRVLRLLGWPVATIEIPAPTAERPDRFIAKYVMPQWVLQELEATNAR